MRCQEEKLTGFEKVNQADEVIVFPAPVDQSLVLLLDKGFEALNLVIFPTSTSVA
jgi:hypothetical protein